MNAKLTEYTRTLEKNPASNVFARIADIHRQSGDINKAIEMCEQGILGNPDYITGYLILGRCYLERGITDKALETFEKALLIDRRNILAIKMLGDIMISQGKKKEGVQKYAEIIVMDPLDSSLQELFRKYKGKELVGDPSAVKSLENKIDTVMEEISPPAESLQLEPVKDLAATETIEEMPQETAAAEDNIQKEEPSVKEPELPETTPLPDIKEELVVEDHAKFEEPKPEEQVVDEAVKEVLQEQVAQETILADEQIETVKETIDTVATDKVEDQTIVSLPEEPASVKEDSDIKPSDENVPGTETEISETQADAIPESPAVLPENIEAHKEETLSADLSGKEQTVVEQKEEPVAPDTVIDQIPAQETSTLEKPVTDELPAQTEQDQVNVQTNDLIMDDEIVVEDEPVETKAEEESKSGFYNISGETAEEDNIDTKELENIDNVEMEESLDEESEIKDTETSQEENSAQPQETTDAESLTESPEKDLSLVEEKIKTVVSDDLVAEDSISEEPTDMTTEEEKQESEFYNISGESAESKEMDSSDLEKIQQVEMEDSLNEDEKQESAEPLKSQDDISHADNESDSEEMEEEKRDEKLRIEIPEGFASSTLAELFYKQGQRDQAIDVYRFLLSKDPANEKFQNRILQIETEKKEKSAVTNSIESAPKKRGRPNKTISTDTLEEKKANKKSANEKKPLSGIKIKKKK